MNDVRFQEHRIGTHARLCFLHECRCSRIMGGTAAKARSGTGTSNKTDSPSFVATAMSTDSVTTRQLGTTRDSHLFWLKAEVFLDNYDGNPDNDWCLLESRRVELFGGHYVPDGSHDGEYLNGPWRVSRFRVADFGPKRATMKLKFTFQFTAALPLRNAGAIDDVWVWDMTCDPPGP